jgi:hypothetical protein
LIDQYHTGKALFIQDAYFALSRRGDMPVNITPISPFDMAKRYENPIKNTLGGRKNRSNFALLLK